MKTLLHLIAVKSDAQAFKQFYVLLYDKLFKFALHITKSEQYSEEVVSDVFMAIWENRKKLPEINNIESYLYKSVKNTALNYIQKNRINTHLTVPIASIHYMCANTLNPENTLEKNEIELKLQKAIDSLPEQCRIIFKLVHEDNLKYKQIAEILDISVRTIDAQMAIARQKLRNILQVK